ncbi:MAG: site-specific integrase [Actinomycetota bacterium]|nr:MAG: site-specific integrase [Actinomycetota bacterium]
MLATIVHTSVEYSWDCGSPWSLSMEVCTMVANTTDQAEAADGGRRRRRVWGAVEQLPSGRFRARMVAPDGRYVSAPTTFTTRTDAAVWLDLQHADLVRGVWKAPRTSAGAASTVAEYVARWIEQHPTAKDSTKGLYRGLLRGCIAPDLGKVRLGALTADTVRAWHFSLGRRLAADCAAERDRLALAGRAPSSASVRDGRTRQAQAYRLLRAAMATAHADGLIGEQPCRIAGAGTPRPSVERRDLAERLLSPGQVRQVATAMPPRYRALVLAAAWSGLRQGELLALTRADLDLHAVPPVVRVRRRVRRNDDGSMDVDTPKSTASVRTVALPGPLRDALVEHLARFASDSSGALVFATSRGTVPARSNLTMMLQRATAAAGLPPIRFHDLRHCAQVLAAESGATLAELMARMGHSTPNAAQVYMHARAERDRVLADAVGAAISADGSWV